jgi:hypothetical protein
MTCVGLLGGDGGEVRELSDVAIVVPTSDTQRIQEVHTVLLHALCELIEENARSAAGEEEPIALVPAEGDVIDLERPKTVGRTRARRRHG